MNRYKELQKLQLEYFRYKKRYLKHKKTHERLKRSLGMTAKHHDIDRLANLHPKFVKNREKMRIAISNCYSIANEMSCFYTV